MSIRFGHCTSCPFDNSSVKLCKARHAVPFVPQGTNDEQGLGLDRVCEAQRSNESPSGAFKRQRGLAQARWRGLAPTSVTPTRSLRKCRRIEEVKSRMDRKFSRIENLWPRDGSCPLPLRSKSFPGNCFRIVKAQKISRGGAAHVRESPFAPNEVPASVCAAALSGSPTESVRSWHSITFRRLMKDSRYSMKKAGRSADTTFYFFQTQE